MSDTTAQLRASAAAFLRYTKQCPIVAFERGLEYNNRPDILAVTKARYLVEIEIKISLSDFKADFKKHKWKVRYYGVKRRQFYYCVPASLVQKVVGIVPKEAGLITIADRSMNGIKVIRVVHRAWTDRSAPRLSLKQMVEMVRNQSGTLCTLAQGVANAERVKGVVA